MDLSLPVRIELVWPAVASLLLAACGRDPAPPPSTASAGSPGGGPQPALEQPASVVPAAVGASRPVALVELYTSQGCSSCPSADSVANALDKAAAAKKQRVYVLAFHVDYWDNIGWPDPYSSAAHTERQREKSRKRGKSGIFTPEAIVQGTESFVGSDSARMQKAVAAALEASPEAPVEKLTVDPSSRTVSWQVGSLPKGARVHVAVAERGIVTDVKSGENAGRKLAHEGVVRSFQSSTLAKGSMVVAKLPQRGSVVAFVEAEDGAVLGAEAVDLDAGAVASRLAGGSGAAHARTGRRGDRGRGGRGWCAACSWGAAGAENRRRGEPPGRSRGRTRRGRAGQGGDGAAEGQKAGKESGADHDASRGGRYPTAPRLWMRGV